MPSLATDKLNDAICLIVSMNPVSDRATPSEQARNLSHTNRSTDSRLVVSLRHKTHVRQIFDDCRLCTNVTPSQIAGLEAQERELRAAGCDKIFREQVSSVAERQQLEAALDYVREGDSSFVTKLDRLARSVGDLLAIVARLEAKKVGLRVLSMSGAQSLDTSHAHRPADAERDRRCGAGRTGGHAGASTRGHRQGQA